jgi:hypothetical protein
MKTAISILFMFAAIKLKTFPTVVIAKAIKAKPSKKTRTCPRKVKD